MQKLRTLHLYLGCVFAPMLLFMAISGIWQTLGWRFDNSKRLALLFTIHTSRALKTGEPSSLSSLFLRDFILATAVGFILTVILGVVMALKYGRSRKAAIGCLCAGVVIPLAAVLVKLFV